MTAAQPSRRYVKRIWRVPKDRGALEFLAVQIVKALVKHGWPARWEYDPQAGGAVICSHDHGEALPPDFLAAVEAVTRITARSLRVELDAYRNFVALAHDYEVTPRGTLKRTKQ